jgi:Bax inhibitor 1 like
MPLSRIRNKVDKHLKRIVAQTCAIVSLLAVAALMTSLFWSKHTPLLQYVANGLTTIAVGYNLYFLFNWVRALQQSSSRCATVVIGVGWLIVFTGVSFVVAAVGFAHCAGGCAASSPSASDWYGGFGMLAVGVVFNALLHWVRSYLADPIKSR